jgi:hypothetical protein
MCQARIQLLARPIGSGVGIGQVSVSQFVVKVMPNSHAVACYLDTRWTDCTNRMGKRAAASPQLRPRLALLQVAKYFARVVVPGPAVDNRNCCSSTKLTHALNGWCPDDECVEPVTQVDIAPRRECPGCPATAASADCPTGRSRLVTPVVREAVYTSKIARPLCANRASPEQKRSPAGCAPSFRRRCAPSRACFRVAGAPFRRGTPTGTRR